MFTNFDALDSQEALNFRYENLLEEAGAHIFIIP